MQEFVIMEHEICEKITTKNVKESGAFGIAVRGKIKRRRRRWPTPHAEFAISLCGVHYPHTRDLAEKLALFCQKALGDYTSFAL